MLKLVLASQKGGVGKTTLALHLAVAAHEAGAGPVVMVDTDPQGSLASAWNLRAAEQPAMARTSIAEIETTLQELEADGFRLVVIDTPPAITATISSVLALADLVVVPTRPSPVDLASVGVTLDLIEKSGNRPFYFVINAAKPKARLVIQSLTALAQHGRVATTIHDRVDFPTAMIDGRTAGELDPKCKAATEITNLWKIIEKHLNKREASG
ncbi:MAG: AAA family ATPase [Azospirillum sp.]|nr:AAA family ATPase [Azospirillum sp.]